MRNTMMATILVLVMAAAAHAADSRPVDITPARTTTPVAADLAKPAEPKAEAKPAPAAESEEFAGTTMIRFFAKTFEAAKESGKCSGLRGSDSIQIAAY